MTATNPDRLTELLRRQRRAARVPAVVAAWSSLGVSVSPLSDERQQQLVGRLRAAESRAVQSTSSYEEAVTGFTRAFDMVAVVGWDVNEEPAVLAAANGITRSATQVCEMYPDGFLLADEQLGSALLVDFDDESAMVLVEHVVLNTEA